MPTARLVRTSIAAQHTTLPCAVPTDSSAGRTVPRARSLAPFLVVLVVSGRGRWSRSISSPLRTMFGRRKVAPLCAVLGAWALVTLYFFGRSGPLPTTHSLLKDDEPIVRESANNAPDVKLQDMNNDFNVDEYKKVGSLRMG